ncbi:MAG: DUF4124 domain-containing protein [Hydrogenophilus sp.]|nr:DUF4124 domain-containing protein [Hydrogenophilus sp.]
MVPGLRRAEANPFLLLRLTLAVVLLLAAAGVDARLWKCRSADGHVTYTNMEPRGPALARCQQLIVSPPPTVASPAPAPAPASSSPSARAPAPSAPFLPTDRRRAILEHEAELEKEALAAVNARLAASNDPAERAELESRRNRHQRNLAAIARELHRLSPPSHPR